MKLCSIHTDNNNKEGIFEAQSYLDPQFYVEAELTEEEQLPKTPKEKNSRNMTMKINIKNLIEVVKSRPGLWDTAHDDYKDKVKKKDLWDEAVMFFLKGDSTHEKKEEMVCSLQRKWKSLRNSYTREIQQRLKSGLNGPRKQYVFFKQLSFLQNVVKVKSVSSISDDNSNENGSNASGDGEDSPTTNERLRGAGKRSALRCSVQSQEYSVEGDDEAEMEADINIELLIDEIQARPALWDISHKDYRNKLKRKHIWRDLVDLFLESSATQEEKKEMVTNLQRKWKSLRNSFTREIQQKLKSGSFAPRKEYVFFNQLSFLQNVVKIKNGSSFDDNPAPFSPDVSLADEKPDISAPCAKKRKMAPQDKQMENGLNFSFQSSENSMEDDEDRLFLLSLVKEMKKIPEHSRFGTRMQIMQVIDNAARGNNQQLFNLQQYQQQNYFTPIHLGNPGQTSFISLPDLAKSPSAQSNDSHPSN